MVMRRPCAKITGKNRVKLTPFRWYNLSQNSLKNHDFRPNTKFFAFDGVVKALFIASDRQTKGEETKFDFYDDCFNHLPFRNGHPNAKIEILKPTQFEKMKELASALSKGFPHVRVDFYEVNGAVFFGELTFSHWSGFTPFDPESWDKTFGGWIDLSLAYSKR